MTRQAPATPGRHLFLALLALSSACALTPATRPTEEPPEPPVSDVMRAPRPAGGQYFGLYALGKTDGVPALVWSEWVAAYVGGEWVHLDPAWGQTVADATHLVVGEERRADIELLLGQLKVTDITGAPSP